jgi:uncharacterized surface protein with fasciclin (FAS1) repeats
MMKKTALYALLISSMILVGVCMGASNSIATRGMSPGESPGGENIVDTAIAAGNFQTLLAALQTAGVADTLRGEGSFTLFAPTDEAFAKIPEAQLSALMANNTQLTALLTYHVLPGSYMSADLMDGMLVKTVSGENLTISLANGGVMVNDANVVQADIVCTNGVIHVIDTVLVPRAVSRAANLNLSKSNIDRMRKNSTSSLIAPEGNFEISTDDTTNVTNSQATQSDY